MSETTEKKEKYLGDWGLNPYLLLAMPGPYQLCQQDVVTWWLLQVYHKGQIYYQTYSTP